MKQVYTYFWKTLPIEDLIWLALIWLTFSQKLPNRASHLKSPKNCVDPDARGKRPFVVLFVLPVLGVAFQNVQVESF